jgi:hypothetical protein
LAAQRAPLVITPASCSLCRHSNGDENLTDHGVNKGDASLLRKFFLMMKRSSCIWPLIILSGCSAAEATGLDSSDNVQCFILASSVVAFTQSVQPGEVPPEFSSADFRRAALFVQDWYGRRIEPSRRSRDEFNAAAAPAAQAAQENPDAARRTFIQCTERAMRESGLVNANAR